MINPQKYSLTSDELLKIFPQSYYTKYANHLKILQFEKKILVQKQDKKSHLNFLPRKNIHQERIRSAIPKQQEQRIKMNYYDTFQDTIDKNKLQLKRMGKYNSILGMKMSVSPSKRNLIRSPAKNQTHLQDSVFDNMKAIQDLEFQRMELMRHKMKVEIERRSVCKFVKKCQSAKIMKSKSKMQVSPPQNNESKTKAQRQLALKLQEIAQFSLQKNESITENVSKSQQKNALIINNINRAIRRSHSTLRRAGLTQKQQQKAISIFQMRNVSKTSLGHRSDVENRKSLIDETKRIKQQVIPIFKRSDNLLNRKTILNLEKQ